MAFSEMIHWCERCMHGRKINAIIGQERDPDLDENYEQVVTALASANHQ